MKELLYAIEARYNESNESMLLILNLFFVFFLLVLFPTATMTYRVSSGLRTIERSGALDAERMAAYLSSPDRKMDDEYSDPDPLKSIARAADFPFWAWRYAALPVAYFLVLNVVTMAVFWRFPVTCCRPN